MRKPGAWHPMNFDGGEKGPALARTLRRQEKIESHLLFVYCAANIGECISSSTLSSILNLPSVRLAGHFCASSTPLLHLSTQVAFVSPRIPGVWPLPCRSKPPSHAPISIKPSRSSIFQLPTSGPLLFRSPDLSPSSGRLLLPPHRKQPRLPPASGLQGRLALQVHSNPLSIFLFFTLATFSTKASSSSSLLYSLLAGILACLDPGTEISTLTHFGYLHSCIPSVSKQPTQKTGQPAARIRNTRLASNRLNTPSLREISRPTKHAPLCLPSQPLS